MKRPLAIIPTYLRRSHDLEVTQACLRTLRDTAGDGCDVLVVDDGSPARDLVDGLADTCRRLDAELLQIQVNAGFSSTVNHGLRRAVDEGADAVLINADISFDHTVDWLDIMLAQRDSRGNSASVVGALLLYPEGLIQHGGIGFSELERGFFHLYHFGPADLPEAHVTRVCPVTGALQFISLECLEAVGPYDEQHFRMGWEDVDFNLRVMLSGRECIYQPAIVATHHESLFRGRTDEKIARWTEESWMHFCGKWADQNFAALVPGMAY